MTILVDARPISDPLQGGVSRVAQGLLHAMTRTMHDDSFVFATTGLHRPTLGVEPHHHLTIPNKLWSAACVSRLVSLDPVFNHPPADLLFLPNLGFVGRPRIPYALLVHDLSFLLEPHWFSRRGYWWHHAVRARELIKNASVLFAVSERTKQDLVDLLQIPADRIVVIPLGLDAPTDEDVHHPLLENQRYFVALGGTNRRKNADAAIAAISELRHQPTYKDVLLVLLGTTHRQSYPPFVLPLGKPKDRARDTLLRHAAGFLYPSWYEGFGIPLHEAARFHIPCVASTAGALPETAPVGTLFAPPSKPHLWMEAMEMMLREPSAYQTQTSLGSWQPAGEIVKQTLHERLHT